MSNKRRFLWYRNSDGAESCKISVNRNNLKRYIRTLYPGQKILFVERDQNFIYVINKDGDLGTISWVKEP